MSDAAAAFWGGGGEFEGRLGPWSVLILDEQVFPGVNGWDQPGACPVTISGPVGYRIDDQKVRGKDGHKLVVTAYEAAKLTATVKIYTSVQWEAFCAYLPRINPKIKENERRAFRVSHPDLRAFQINQVYINQITLPEEHDGRMVKVVKMTLWEVFDLRAKSSTAKPKQTDPAAGRVKVDQPFQNVDGQVFVEPRNPRIL